MKVIFITEKYHTREIKAITNNHWNLRGSFEIANLGEFQEFFIDPEDIWSTEGVDDVLLNNQYDAAIISVYHHLPSTYTLQKIGYKTCLLWWDAIVSRPQVNHYSSMCPQIIFDHGYGKEAHNIHAVEVPQDTRVFYKDDNIAKDIDISFAGSVDSHRPDRKQTIDRLINAGFNVWYGGGRGVGYDNMDINEYANIFRRSKISLNLQFGHGGRMQRKGRTFELGACGSFMMANACEMFGGREGRFFEPEVDYASFDHINLEDRVKYFLDHEEERKTIANNFYKKYQENYSPKPFWTKILKICGANI